MLTFDLREFWHQGQVNFRRVDAHQLVLIGLDVSELTDDFLYNIIRVRADVVNFRSDKLMDRENVGHLDVQCRLRLGVKVVEFINVKVGLCILHGYH